MPQNHSPSTGSTGAIGAVVASSAEGAAFDAESRPTRLVTNEHGDPLGYDLDDQDRVIDGEDALIVLPPDIAAVARDWLADHLANQPSDDA